MPRKETLIEQVKKQAKEIYTKKEVAHLMFQVSEKNISNMTYVKKGDVIQIFNSNKIRPAVIAKIKKDVVWALPISTTEDEINLLSFRSRFFGDGFFSKSIVPIKKHQAIEHFMGVFDNPKRLNKAIKILKEELESL